MLNGTGSFFAFYREYAKTGVHAASAALLTAFGLLTSVDQAFLIVAVAVYIIPLLYFYGAYSNETKADGNQADAPHADETLIDEEATTDDEATDAAEPGWGTSEVPVESTLYDVAATANGAVAVGATGVVLLDDSGGWRTVVEDGPSAAGETLRGVAASDDGRAVWFAGDGGALGVYDTEHGYHTDVSEPADYTDTWTDIAITGRAGAETVYLVNGSGQILRGKCDGNTRPSWDLPIKPGSGSSISAIEFATDTAGFCCDTNGVVLATTDGAEYAVVGIDGADALIDIAPATTEAVTVAAVDGLLHRYDGSTWTPLSVSDGALTAVARYDSEGVAVDDTGSIFVRDGMEWKQESSVKAALRGVALSADRAIAVGDEGCIVERQ